MSHLTAVNQSAAIANRALTGNASKATTIIAKLSAGTRVLSFKYDALSAAIGTRLQTELSALNQSAVSAGEAASMLYIADQALATMADNLAAMKVLAVQAATGNVGAVGRAYLDHEFGELRTEVDRIAYDTEFNGLKLLQGVEVAAVTSTSYAATGIGANIAVDTGFETFTIETDTPNVSDGDTIRVEYAQATQLFTVTNTTTSQIATAAGPPGGVGSGEFFDVAVADFGLTIRLNDNFNEAIDNPEDPQDPTALNEFTVSGTTTIVTPATQAALTLTYKVGTGTDGQDDVAVEIDPTDVSNLAAGLELSSLLTVSGAASATTTTSEAIDKLAEIQADVEASQSRLKYVQTNLLSFISNTVAARSEVPNLDVDLQKALLTATLNLIESGIRSIAQANSQRRSLVDLLRD